MHAGRRLGEGADDRPHEGALTLLIDPGRKVVGDPQAVEPGRAGEACLLEQLLRGVFLADRKYPIFMVAPYPDARRGSSAGSAS